MNLFLDTNVLVAACLEKHEHHTRAIPLLQSIHAKKAQGFVSAHSVLELYAILTRLPQSPRISAEQASKLIEDLLSHFSVVALSSKEYAELIRKLGVSGVSGGKSYDRLHLACAEKCAADRIYTFNLRHFSELAGHIAHKLVTP